MPTAMCSPAMSSGEVSARIDRPPDPLALLVLGHGAGREGDRLQVGGEIGDAEGTNHVVVGCLHDNARPLVGDGSRDFEAAVRHAAATSPSGTDRIGECDRLATAEWLSRLGPSEEDVG